MEHLDQRHDQAGLRRHGAKHPFEDIGLGFRQIRLGREMTQIDILDLFDSTGHRVHSSSGWNR